MTFMVADTVFAPIDTDLHMERIAGGNETEVYCTDDRRFVVKVKSEERQHTREALVDVKTLRTTAQSFADAVGFEHSIPNYFLVSRNREGRVQPVILQPFLGEAEALFDVDYGRLNKQERKHVAKQLKNIIRRSLAYYNDTGRLPDLYGRTSSSKSERKQLNKPHMLPKRLWGFVVKRNLLRAHNLMLTAAPERRVVLVDYDPVQRGKLYQFVYYNVRRVLFLRDLALLKVMEKTGYVPKA
jgi:hypothetical protein